MSGLGNMNKSRGNGQRGDNNTEGLVLQIKEYHITDPKKATPSDDDYIVGILMRPGLGKGEGEEVKLKLRPAREGENFARRPPILELHNGKKPLGKKMLPMEGVIRVSNAYLDAKTGFVMARWADRKYADYVSKPDNAWPLLGLWGTVRNEYYRDKEGQERRYEQKRLVVMPEQSVAVTDVESFRAAAIEQLHWLNGRDAAGVEQNQPWPGNAGVVIRGVNSLDIEQRAAVEISAWWNKDAERIETPEETVDRWLASEDGQGWQNEVFNDPANGSTQFLEVFPMLVLDTGKQSLPFSQKENAIQNGGTVDEYKDARFDDSFVYRTQAKSEQVKKPATAFAVSDTFVQRHEPENAPGTLTKWYVTETKPVMSRPVLFDLRDLPSKVLGQELSDRLGAFAKSRPTSAPDAAPEAAPESAPDAGASYGM